MHREAPHPKTVRFRELHLRSRPSWPHSHCLATKQPVHSTARTEEPLCYEIVLQNSLVGLKRRGLLCRTPFLIVAQLHHIGCESRGLLKPQLSVHSVWDNCSVAKAYKRNWDLHQNWGKANSCSQQHHWKKHYWYEWLRFPDILSLRCKLNRNDSKLQNYMWIYSQQHCKLASWNEVLDPSSWVVPNCSNLQVP